MINMSQKAADLKQAIDTSLQELAEAVDEQQASEEMKHYLDLMARFHKYSWGNCWLIAQQRPDSSLVGGFHHWRRLDQIVKAGEIHNMEGQRCKAVVESPASLCTAEAA